MESKYEDKINSENLCKDRYEYDNIGVMEWGINPCGSCQFYDECKAKNKGSQAK